MAGAWWGKGKDGRSRGHREDARFSYRLHEKPLDTFEKCSDLHFKSLAVGGEKSIERKQKAMLSTLVHKMSHPEYFSA